MNPGTAFFVDLFFAASGCGVTDTCDYLTFFAAK